MKRLIFYEKKANKVKTESHEEIDLIDLEAFGGNRHRNEFLKIPSSLVGNKTIIEWFAVGDASYWWLICNTIFSRFDEGAQFVSRFLGFVRQHHPDSILLKGNFEKLDIIKQICILQGIKLSVSKKDYISFLSKHYAKNLVKTMAYHRITNAKHRKRFLCYDMKKDKMKMMENCTIITASGKYRRDMVDPEDGKIKRQEFIFQPILDLVYKNDIPTVCFDLDYTFRGETGMLEERLKSNFNWLPIEVLLQIPKGPSAKKSLGILQKSIKELKNNLGDLFSYEKISMRRFMEPVFDEIFLEPYLPTFLHLIESVEDFFTKNKPRVVIQVYETGPYAKIFEMAAKKLGIRTIGMQHGLIMETMVEYMYREIKTKNFPLGNPIPDLTLVFGEYYKKILTERGCYPEENVLVIGNPTFYNIDKIQKIYERKNILEKYKIPNRKTVFVPLSFNIFDEKNNSDKIILDALYDGLKNDEITILLRPHPLYPFEENMLAKFYPSHLFKVSNGTLVEDIIASDIVISSGSTAALDSTIFGKRVIFVNFKDKSNGALGEILDYMIRNGVAISIGIGELVMKIKEIEREEREVVESSEKKTEFIHSLFNHDKTVDLMKAIYG